MSKVDRRGRLAEDPFEYRVTKNGQVFVSRNGRQVTTVAGAQAKKLIAQIDTGDQRAIQLALAKASGTYKHGSARRS